MRAVVGFGPVKRDSEVGAAGAAALAVHRGQGHVMKVTGALTGAVVGEEVPTRGAAARGEVVLPGRGVLHSHR